MPYNFDEIIARRHTNCVKYDLLKEYFGDENLLPLWVADMDFKTPDFVVKAVQQRAAHEIYGYSIRSSAYDEAIINWLKRRHHWEIEREWLSFSPGVVPALNMLVMAFTQPGDEVIVQPPVYFPFFSAVENHGRILVHNQLKYHAGKYSMDLEDLKSKISSRTRLLLLCHPHNPVGRCWTKEELSDLAEICIENKIVIVSDEIHSDLALPPHRHQPLAAISEAIAMNTITTIAPSKTFNLAGMATSAIICQNPELKKKYDHVLDQVHVGMGNLFGAVAAEAAYKSGDQWLDELLDYIAANHDFVVDYLKNNLPQIRPIPLEATYLLWLDFSDAGFSTDQEMKDFIIQKARLALSDGPSFGPGGSGFMRMNLASPRVVIERALNQLKEAFQKHQQIL
jgi:cysteine-S-conjugate beta-lyase